MKHIKIAAIIICLLVLSFESICFAGIERMEKGQVLVVPSLTNSFYLMPLFGWNYSYTVIRAGNDFSPAQCSSIFLSYMKYRSPEYFRLNNDNATIFKGLGTEIDTYVLMNTQKSNQLLKGVIGLDPKAAEYLNKYDDEIVLAENANKFLMSYPILLISSMAAAFATRSGIIPGLVGLVYLGVSIRQPFIANDAYNDLDRSIDTFNTDMGATKISTPEIIEIK